MRCRRPVSKRAAGDSISRHGSAGSRELIVVLATLLIAAVPLSAAAQEPDTTAARADTLFPAGVEPDTTAAPFDVPPAGPQMMDTSAVDTGAGAATAAPTVTPLGPPPGMVRIQPGRLPDPLRQLRDEGEAVGWSQGFDIDRHEVTNKQFARFLSAGANNAIFFDERMYITETTPGTFVADEGKDTLPVTFVNWFGAYAYAEWAGKSLPTEEEWVLACLGSYSDQDLTMWYPWGQTDPDSIDANLLDPSRIGRPDSVGSHPLSDAPGGISDMAGNVAEWTLTSLSSEGAMGRQAVPDTLRMDATGAAPIDSTLRFVVKGGSFLDPPINTQLNRRATRYPDERYHYVGFRCVRRQGEGR